MVTLILAQIAPRSTKNAITAIPKVISLPYAGNPNQIGDLIMLEDLVLEAGREDPAPELPADGTLDHKAEADSHTEAPAHADTAATAEVPHKTITEDHLDAADVVPHRTDSRLAISHLPLIHPKLMKVSCTLIELPMVTSPSTLPCNSS